tara:strand:+ start:328 stop:918 length:591 start_codon:yes stop_codon:yes gene_type:complete
MSSRSRIQLEEWLKTLKPEGKILDIGGSQLPIWRRTDCESGQVTILDLKKPHEETAKVDIVMDIQQHILEFPEASEYFGGFDTAFCIEVSEYWYDPYRAFDNIHRFLKPGGILYISFHWLYGLHNPKGEDCLRYTENAVRKLAAATGFEVENIKVKDLTGASVLMMKEFYLKEGMRLDYRDPKTYEEGYLVRMKKI